MSDGIKVFWCSIEKVLEKYEKWFLKMCGKPELRFRP